MKFSIISLGCKTNQSETATLERFFQENSHKAVSLEEHPDICIINTCTVTAKSDYQSRQLIRRALNLSGRVFVTGCYSELNKSEIMQIDSKIEIVRNNEKIDFFRGSATPSVMGLATPGVMELATSGIMELATSEVMENAEKSALSTSATRSRAFLKIQDGCNWKCSYCIITKARGASISSPKTDIVAEAAAAEYNGFNEAVLTGIHIGQYGLDLKPKVTLSILIENILQKTKKIRLRISSLEAGELDERLFELLKEDRVCKHIHIPVQSGDDEILSLMNRPHKIEKFREITERLNREIENISIGTDVIVGFPGETDAHFENTYRFLQSTPLTYLHVFPYSKRKGTAAFNMSNHIAKNIKKERALRLRALSEDFKDSYMKKQPGRTLKAIVESNDGALVLATTDNYLKVTLQNVANIPIKHKSLINLIVTAYTNNSLTGSPINII
ncbi:MAG: tRNA (N(6)-L-threonylcarbamoyladenosine(37)-C(2))-methylthiotransferase MtaB [Nitrospirae bacterium]|nr:tRNA (N(6)-L-threonylcarbamoyladenosine(37)-C(2))-methylthiotransferase MtaB [Nitrospirota bacterium]MBF0535037.1 tRNA (N(6)-L-threonylcarbamoyladenosine(37)-C(2))-methylthiotransferase MtaB [Nitrospirota bacterium]MBF0616545.1 tRNA (N(6)-L-threonylcarbamoyladenosine(37)-C(2))-methylthiotransferase MtaB [Nitrospirota bacterium]